MSEVVPGLAEKMRRLAADHPRSDELLAKAQEFETKKNGFYAEPQTVDVKSFMGAWARARRLYCEISGESLI